MPAPKLSLAVAIMTSLVLAAPSPSFARAAATTAAAAPQPGPKKLTIIGLDNGVKFTAQFNPKEIKVDKSVPWSKSPTSTGDQPELQFRSAEGRTMSFELSFDTYEDKTDVHSTHIAKLLSLAMVMDPGGAEDKKRPPRVKVSWGTSALVFEGVIVSLDTKYTLFLADGTPVRASCVVTLREASRASFKK